MERLTRRGADGGVTLAEGCTVSGALERLAGYENVHALQAEARLAALRGQGRARSAGFQQALAEKLRLAALLERLEKLPGEPPAPPL